MLIGFQRVNESQRSSETLPRLSYSVACENSLLRSYFSIIGHSGIHITEGIILSISLVKELFSSSF